MFLYTYENLKKASKTKKGKEYCKQLEKYYEQNFKNNPIKALTFSKFKLFHLTGNRTEYQNEYYDRRIRLNVLQVLSIYNNAYLEELEDVIFAICDEITWAIPAHCYDFETNTYKYREIDLQAVETAMYLAEIDYVFKDKLSPEIRNRIKYSLQERIVNQYENRTFKFDTMGNNWASVCSCGVGLTYLYAFPERFNLVKDRIFGGMERYLGKLDKDGYCSEGFAYWIYGFGFFTLFYDVYYQLTGEKPLILDSEVVKNSVKYAENSILGDGVYIPISDGALSSFSLEDDAVPVINNLFNANIQINGGKLGVSIGKALSLRRLYFINQKVKPCINTKKSLFFEKSQVLVEKTSNYIFIAKGGNNAEMHNHNDIGSFSIFKNGVQYIVDPGSGEYTKGYFGSEKERYSIETFVCNSLAHSVPIVDGLTQKYGKDYFASVLNRTKNNICYDLSSAYPNKVNKLTVNYTLNENGVTASYEAKGLQKGITFRFISFIKPKISGNKVLIGDMLVLASKVQNINVMRYEFSNHQAEKTTAYAIDYVFENISDINAQFDFNF